MKKKKIDKDDIHFDIFKYALKKIHWFQRIKNILKEYFEKYNIFLEYCCKIFEKWPIYDYATEVKEYLLVLYTILLGNYAKNQYLIHDIFK